MANYRSEVDQYGFERPDDFDYNTYDDFMADYLRVLARRAAKWESLMEGKTNISKSRKVKRYIRKGVPSEHRGDIWLLMSGAKEKMESNKGHYEELLALEKDQSIVDLIEKDTTRTFPENIYFKPVPDSQLRPLKNVLTAFSLHNKAIGYCQGINYIVGMLLLVTKNEEHTFWILCQLLQEKLPDFYCTGMVGLRAECATLTEFLRLRHGDLYALFRKHNLDLELMVSKWFICLFMDVLPVETVLRIWDCLLYEGSKILLRVALTLIVLNKEQFLICKDFTEICTLFKGITQSVNVLKCHDLMQSIFTVPGSLPMATVSAVRKQCREAIDASRIKR